MLKLKIAAVLLSFIFCAGCGNEQNGKKPVEKDNSAVSVNSEINSFIFVGMYNDRPALYRYDFNSGRSKLIWSKLYESVVDLAYTNNKKFAFFVTARRYDRSGASFYIRGVKVYLVNLKTGNIKFITSMGNGVQIFTSSGVDNSFKIIINSIDTTIANYINQNTKIFNTYGKLLVNKTEIFNLAKSGYPVPQKQNENYDSPDKKYTIETLSDSSSSKIYLVDNNEMSKSLIKETVQKLNDISWYYDKYIFISTIDLSTKNKSLSSEDLETSGLIIYSIKKNKILKSWSGAGLKNFIIINDYLIFDDGFGEKSSINIFNYKKLKLVNIIKIEGGCGVRKIPELPEIGS